MSSFRRTIVSGAETLLLLVLLTVLSGPGCQPRNQAVIDPAAIPNEEPRRYQFTRGASLLLRTDTRTGAVWISEVRSENGWQAIGSAPDDGGNPLYNNRFGVFSFKTAGISLGGSPQAVVLMRVDRANGRAWLADPDPASEWVLIPGGGSPKATASGEEDPAPPPATSPGSAIVEPEVLPVLDRETLALTNEDESAQVAVVVEALNKPGLPVKLKVWAASQLSVFDPDLAIPPLINALGNEEPEVVVAAIDSLKRMGRPKTIPKILALQSHPDPRVRQAVSRAVMPVP